MRKFGEAITAEGQVEQTPFATKAILFMLVVFAIAVATSAYFGHQSDIRACVQGKTAAVQDLGEMPSYADLEAACRNGE